MVEPQDWRAAILLFPFGPPHPVDTELRLSRLGIAARFGGRLLPSVSLLLRGGTTDQKVFEQVLLSRQYEPPRPVGAVEFVVDAGANVGYSSVYLLRRYPAARVVALEPDPANFAAAVRNLAPFGPRCLVLRAALWKSAGVASVSTGTFRDGREWATEVVEWRAGEDAVVETLTLDDVLERARFPRVDYLKVDIEGSELQLLSAKPNLDVMSRSRLVAIELHSNEARQLFLHWISTWGWDFCDRGEVTFAWPTHVGDRW